MNENQNTVETQDVIHDAYTWGELKNTAFDYEALLEPYIPQVGIAAVVGMPDSGKSMLCRNLAFAVAYGEQEFLGLPLRPRHQRALFVTTEDTVEATKYCFGKIGSTYPQENAEQSDNNLHLLLADDLTPDEIVARIEEYLSATGFDLVIIDAYGDVFRGGEGNSNIQNRNSLRPFSVLAKKHGLAIVFVHHTNKAARNLSPDHVHVQGGSGFVQKVRTVLELRPSKEDNAVKFLACTKGNGVPDQFKKEALVLKFDAENFRYHNTGDKKKVMDLKFDQGPTAIEKIRGDELFRSDEEGLTRQDLVKRIEQQFAVSESTAKRWLNANLKTTSRGIYANPAFTSAKEAT
ncbi:MAG: AAA family ATPase [Bacteroidota bacterium]|nr:AAA family ATPase [Bacteroidota bacterium]MDP4235099.1 AAA family ATPase [Bacteroidota bacterium]